MPALITVLALIYRVLINQPGLGGVVEARAGAYVGLLSAVVLFYGAWRSLRQEGILERTGPGRYRRRRRRMPRREGGT